MPIASILFAMKAHQLLEALEEAVRALGTELEYDDIRKGPVVTYGDAYTLRGEKRILIHKRLDDSEKADLLIEILAGFDTEAIHLAPEVREKIEDYNNKLKGLELKEQRLQIAQDVLKEDVEELNNLRVELTSIVASLKGERDKLLKSRVEVAQTEKANLMSIAATYDKMDATSAGKILTNMNQMESSRHRSDSGIDDAVKILHYMTERTRAKLLAELVTSEPKLAAVLCRRLKQIIEEK